MTTFPEDPKGHGLSRHLVIRKLQSPSDLSNHGGSGTHLDRVKHQQGKEKWCPWDMVAALGPGVSVVTQVT